MYLGYRESPLHTIWCSTSIAIMTRHLTSASHLSKIVQIPSHMSLWDELAVITSKPEMTRMHNCGITTSNAMLMQMSADRFHCSKICRCILLMIQHMENRTMRILVGTGLRIIAAILVAHTQSDMMDHVRKTTLSVVVSSPSIHPMFGAPLMGPCQAFPTRLHASSLTHNPLSAQASSRTSCVGKQAVSDGGRKATDRSERPISWLGMWLGMMAAYRGRYSSGRCSCKNAFSRHCGRVCVRSVRAFAIPDPCAHVGMRGVCVRDR